MNNLKATHEGILKIGGIEIKSYVLEDGTRVLNRIEFLRAIGRTGKAKGGRQYDQEFQLPVFLTSNNLKPFITKELIENSAPIPFQGTKGGKNIGYKAELLPIVCNVFLDATDAKALSLNQVHIAERCKILIRGLATVGIIALVDEATGYQEIRDRKALEKILEKYLLKEHAKWAKRFPDSFYQEMFRLNNWQYNPSGAKRPGIIGKYTNNLIYQRLAPGVLEELKIKNPKDAKGNRKTKFHQWLTEDIGHPKLQEHLSGVEALMRATTTWMNFMRMLERSYPRLNYTLTMNFKEDID